MAHILHLETATDVCSVALGVSGEYVAGKSLLEGRQHISQLSSLCDQVLHQAGSSYHALNAIAVSEGPGSYTGLRVAFATAKGLAVGLNIPIIGVSTLLSLAYAMRRHQGEVDMYVPMLDARRMEVYTAQYDQDLNSIEPVHAAILDDNYCKKLLQSNKRLCFAGNGAFKMEKVLHESESHKSIIINKLECNARHLIDLAWYYYQSNTFLDTAYCKPFYLKPPNITKPKKLL